jgi:glutathione S-transferase
MDRQHMIYNEHEYPYGLHWKRCRELIKLVNSEREVEKKVKVKEQESLRKKPMNLHLEYDFPFLITHNREILRKSTTQILTYIYSRSLFSRLRLYQNPDALSWEQYFDENLAPAVQYIYWNSMMKEKKLVQHYIIDKIHWASHRRLYEWMWPVLWMRWNIFFLYKEKLLDKAIRCVDEAMNKVTFRFEEGGKQYICGTSFSAADLTFASHASLILWPSKTEDYMDNMGIHVPYLEEVSDQRLVNMIQCWKKTLAGQHTIRICRFERGTKFGKRPTRYDREHNPWWTRVGFIIYHGCSSY